MNYSLSLHYKGKYSVFFHTRNLPGSYTQEIAVKIHIFISGYYKKSV